MKSIRTTPLNHAAEGDERIRTAVQSLGAEKVYERRSAAERTVIGEPVRSPESGWVYLISDGGWFAKIGWARNPEKRLAELQAANPERLELLAVMEGSRKTERELHELFASERVRGEWFQRTHELTDYFSEAGFACCCAATADPECFIHGEGLPAW